MRRAHFSLCLGRIAVGTIALVLSSLPGHAGLIATASTGDLYQETTTAKDGKDRAFLAHWADQKDAVWWTSGNPVIRVGRFTDTDGRRVVVTSIRAAPICGISGCPVRIKTEQGEVLAEFSACDLMEDHRVSADGRDFLACDERFPIPKYGSSKAKRTSDAAPPATTHDFYSLQRTIPDRYDPAFQAYWKDLANDIIWDPKAKFHHTISVGNFTDALGRKLTATTVYTMAACGMQICPIRLYTETGERLAEFYGCNANEYHRISPDRRYFFACRQAFRIPASPEPRVEASIGGVPADISRTPLRIIAYDSGSTILSPADQIFRDYWSDKASEINWKASASRRAHTYNAAPDSADGRNLFLTLLLPGSENDCGDQCQLRVFNAKRTLLMDVRVCSDRTQHGVSEDRKSLIACGQTFPIPQVDEKVAIMENAPPDSDPQAYMEVVLRDRKKRSAKDNPIRVDSAYHNKSEMMISEWKDGSVEIIYNHPRMGLPVAQGTLLFQGKRNGDRYSGTAYTFKAGCAPAPYTVSGTKIAARDEIVMSGAAPRRNPNSCDVIGQADRSGHAKLVFDTKFYGDE